MVSSSAPTFAVSRETLLLVAFSYGIGLVMLMTAGIYEGPLAEPALALAVAGLVVLVVLFARLLSGRAMPTVSSSARPWLVALLVALAIFPVATWADRRLLIDATGPPVLIHVLQALELALLATYMTGLVRGDVEPPRWRTARFFLFAVFLFAGGASVIALSPTPHIDVWWLQDAAAKALLRGQNPYVDVHVQETAGEMDVLSFVYPPTPCYLNAIAYAVGGDVRWGILAAVLLIGTATRILRRIDPVPSGSMRPAFVEDAPALLVWLSPKTFFYVEQSWNDVYPLALVALALVAHAYRRKFASALLLGLGLSAKQSMIWFVPLAALLEFDGWQWSAFLGAAAATVVPFAWADFGAMNRWMIGTYVHHSAPRTDALSLSNFFLRHFGMMPRSTPGLVIAAASALLAWWRAPRTRYAFALTATLAFTAFFIVNIWMFINAYFFVMAFALLAASADTASSGSKIRTSRPVLA